MRFISRIVTLGLVSAMPVFAQVQEGRNASGRSAPNVEINKFLKHVYRWAVEQGYLSVNPLLKVAKLEEVQWVGGRPRRL